MKAGKLSHEFDVVDHLSSGVLIHNKINNITAATALTMTAGPAVKHEVLEIHKRGAAGITINLDGTDTALNSSEGGSIVISTNGYACICLVCLNDGEWSVRFNFGGFYTT